MSTDEVKKIVVVLGMHRSGTSAITRGLETMRVALGDNLLPTAADNSKGFWEDLDIIQLNDEMLQAIGQEWHSLRPLQTSDLERLREQGFVTRARQLLISKTEACQCFGFKDPRTAKLLPIWSEVLDTPAFEARYIVALRNPISVVASLVRRDGFDEEKSYLLWVVHVLTILGHANRYPAIAVDYDSLLQEPRQQLARVADWLGEPIDTLELELYCQEFLETGLRHYHVDQFTPLPETALPLAQEVHARLNAVITGEDTLDELMNSAALMQWQTNLDKLDDTLRLLDRLYQRIQDQHDAWQQAEARAQQFSKTLKEITDKPSEPCRVILKRCLVKRGPQLVSQALLRLHQLRAWWQTQRTQPADSPECEGHARRQEATADQLEISPHHIPPRLQTPVPAAQAGQRIALHLRLLQGTGGDTFIDHARNLSVPFDLYVAVSQGFDQEALSEQLRAALPHADQIIIETVPERGRDLAPLIIQFGQRLAEYDVIGHFHTAAPQKALSLLLGTPDAGGDQVAYLLGLLQTEAKILYPQDHEGTNTADDRREESQALVADLLQRHTTRVAATFPRLEHPQAGIFWARTACLREWLQLPLKFTDFPLEPSRNADTLDDALRRIILVMASGHTGRCLRLDYESTG
ncbi:rhamnan synthesis F family protein [Marichromatium bheemlicum]|uniref:Sulfotransferase family protein n=1 Tax=Marichromatium bheemlicum TaxID=365339 RepID=A0ABX1I6E8_9GAMM|nr:rhamnan synthesis F family protein [Marichromatium bheemlicum]NKN32746.1 hypothetical protein [Marichromatium bheemlicum]